MPSSRRTLPAEPRAKRKKSHPVGIARAALQRWNSTDGKKRSFLTVGWNDLLCRNLPTYWRANFNQSSIRATDIGNDLPPWFCLRFFQLGGPSGQGFGVRLDNRRRYQRYFDAKGFAGFTCCDKTRSKVRIPKFVRCKGERCFSCFKFAVIPRLIQKAA